MGVVGTVTDIGSEAISRAKKQAGILKHFSRFAMRGNSPDLAAGVFIGAAFGKTIWSLAIDVLMQSIGALLRKMDVQNPAGIAYR
jgi:large-conductance mechanosensitive channel